MYYRSRFSCRGDSRRTYKRTVSVNQGILPFTSSPIISDIRSSSSDSPRSLRSAGHRSWQIRRPAAQSKLRELRQRARSACFVPMMQKTQNNRDIIDRFTTGYEKEKEEKPFDFSSVVSGCGGITDYRTFMNDFRKCAEFVRWLKEKAEG